MVGRAVVVLSPPLTLGLKCTYFTKPLSHPQNVLLKTPTGLEQFKALVGRGCLRLVPCLSMAGGMPTPLQLPLNLRLSRQKRLVRHSVPWMQSCILHYMEPSSLVVCAVLLGVMVCTAPWLARPLRSVSRYGALPCSPRQPLGAMHIW